MDIYKIADLYIGIKTKSEFAKKYISEYKVEYTEPQFCVEPSDEMIAREKQLAPQPIPEDYYELTAINRCICEKIVSEYNGFFLHCSALMLDGKAYIFTAKSGTGKSTHAALWRKVFGSKVTMINDDKPIVRLIDDTFYIYGTPWNGKHALSNNIKAPVGGVFFLSQAKENVVTKSDTVTSLAKLLAQTILPDTKQSMSGLIDMLSKMCEDIPMFSLQCNISENAVHTAYDAIKQ